MFCTSCGKTLEDGAAFCTGCGKKIEMPNSAATDYSSMGGNSTVYNAYETDAEPVQTQQYEQPQQYGQAQQYGQPQQYGQAQQYSQPQYGQSMGQMPQYGQMNQADARRIYKSSVLPFKVTAGIMNIFTFLAVAIIGLASIGIGEAKDEYEMIYYLDITDKFEAFGYFALIVLIAMFVLCILDFALPAKGGIIANLINTVLGTISCVWGIIISSDAYGKIDKWGVLADEDSKNIMMGFIFIAAVGIFFAFIAVIMELIGLCKKKNY